MSVELDVDTLKEVLSKFAARMGAKWDFIGIQLRQGDLVQDLRSSPKLGKQKVQEIIDEWLDSDDKEVPVCAATVSRVLRSPAVRLGAVAKVFEEEVQRRASSQRAAPQHPVSRPQHSLPPTGAYTSTGASTSHFEGTLSFPDGPSPSNPHGIPQEPPSSNPSSFSQRQPSNPSSLALPQQAQEGGLRPHLPSGGGGRADSGPVQGAGSLVQQPIEEQGGPAEGDVLRGPEQAYPPDDNAEEPVSFAILTANANERKAVRHFLMLDNPIDTTRFPYAERHVWSNDSFLAEKKAIIKPHADNVKKRYPLFYLEVGQERQVGVHVPCNTMGPWGAFDKTVELLQRARDKRWKLRYIFVVGCCGACVIDRKTCPRGTVLLARQVKDYLNTGKVKDGVVDGKPLSHDMGDDWLEDFKFAQEGADPQDPQRIEVEIVNYLTGPLVIKDDLFGKAYCENKAEITGVEMEVVGVIEAVKAFQIFRRIKGKPEQKVVLAKGVSDYTGKKGEKGSCILFGKKTPSDDGEGVGKETPSVDNMTSPDDDDEGVGRETPSVDDDSLQVYATLQSLALVIRFVAGNIQRLFSDIS